jgi:hypothetical protein
VNEDEIKAAIQQAMQAQEAEFAARIAEMQEAHASEIRNLNAGFVPVVEQRPDHNVPSHAGGPGNNIAPTWSMAEQEASRRGEVSD